MAFNAQQDFTQRKILEELQTKKNQLQKGIISNSTTTTAQNGNFISPALSIMYTLTPTSGGPNDIINSSLGIRTVPWAQASSQSFGYFIQTDSQFGNTILPVLPRHDPPPATPNSN